MSLHLAVKLVDGTFLKLEGNLTDCFNSKDQKVLPSSFRGIVSRNYPDSSIDCESQSHSRSELSVRETFCKFLPSTLFKF